MDLKKRIEKAQNWLDKQDKLVLGFVAGIILLILWVIATI